MDRTCSSCKALKPSTEFYEKPKNKCKNCIKSDSLQWRKDNPERWRARRLLMEQTSTRKLSKRASRLRTTYGLELSKITEILEQQEGSCAICKNYARLSIDHDHTTGEVRGILCGNCNAGLGLFRDSLLLIHRAWEYLGGSHV